MAGTQDGDLHDTDGSRVDLGMHTDDAKPGILDSVVRALTDLMSNKHRGYSGLRPGGGIHPVQSIGVETGGAQPGERFDTEYTQAEILQALRDGLFGDVDHVMGVRATGPFSGFILPGHVFQTSQNVFKTFTVGVDGAAEPVRLVNAHPMRLDIMLKRIDTATVASGTVYIGSTETLTAENGYPLTQGEVITIPTRSEVWAISTCNVQANIATISTMRDG